ncbi:ATP-dependent DNA ligase LigD phosphoesterase module /ATP-dependent DNA ligase LigD polymerase module [Flavobacterium micromati]|uniref:DNA ligase (ATP) n=1 Tax=Flavobacterium micromati TaxID=229205 RepID=A0A1M5IRK4_9FLAO|nr:DNA ligase D [Flavobacterium micromati]SHG30891.1 ATP-dependent DNA ligase LigD phosphoesterase module /ATP-dependent DNA ligase LigD polymerase module [Flavobacterium micromati]
MSLEKYNEKRDFKQTVEPEGTVARSKGSLIFVVQKHAASHLHYDFRLEMNGVLKSWAVPKGPSLNPVDKRLAILVEDHPYAYKDFEGAIPKGNYGAGNVIVWDIGTYNLAENENEKETEQQIINDFTAGHLSFSLYGKKLHGNFSLIKLKGTQDNAWLLMKKDDQDATANDILLNNKSVLSGLTLEELQLQSKIAARTNEKNANTAASENQKKEVDFVSPMLASLGQKAFKNADWIFEKKYDGYRTLAVIKNGEVALYSRNQQVFTADFESIATDLKKIKHNVILDGEVVIEDKTGKSNFQMLQNFIKTGKGNLKYYVFDLLNVDDNEIVNLELLARKELLKMLIEKANLSKTFYSNATVEDGVLLFEKSVKAGEEGIMAKKADSVYQIGKRSSDWLKIKSHLEEEAIIIGITKPENGSSYFGALLLTQYQDGNLKYIGKCGSGFTDASLKDLHQKFEPYFIENNPLTEKIAIKEKTQWIQPNFICTVKFAEWTTENRLRHPVFKGLRTDKELKDLTTENILETDSSLPTENLNQWDNNKIAESNLQVKIGKRTLQLTNLSKIYFPEDGISKGELIHYYSEVAEFILPYLKNRPESLNRFPNGISSTSFYQKDFDTSKVPSWLLTEKIVSDSNSSEIDYLICNDKETLIYMVNLGCIDFNPWNSTIKNLENPDWIVIDIDPSTDNFEEVIETALVVRAVLENLNVESYCKTSGASGMHVYVPLGGKYSYESVKLFAQLIAREVQIKLPETTTLERSIKKRNQKIYIDYLQNRKGQTIAAPYSVRPKRGATVSTPLDWSEVHSKLRPSDFTIKNALNRFEKKGDLWKPVLGSGIDLQKVIEKYNS